VASGEVLLEAVGTATEERNGRLRVILGTNWPQKELVIHVKSPHENAMR
jgi:hypothetical protein